MGLVVWCVLLVGVDKAAASSVALYTSLISSSVRLYQGM
jgi:hypothetical protein